MRFSHGNWLARHVFPLQVTIYLVGLRPWGSVIYFPSEDKCNGTEIESKCEHNGKRGVRINDTRSLNKVLGNINDSMEYWTGLSWHQEWGYFWYLNKSLPTRVEENLTDINNSWFCFLVKKGETKLIAERCDESHYYICQDSQTVQPRNVYTGGQPRKRKKRRKKRNSPEREECLTPTCIRNCFSNEPQCNPTQGTEECLSTTCILNCAQKESACESQGECLSTTSILNCSQKKTACKCNGREECLYTTSIQNCSKEEPACKYQDIMTSSGTSGVSEETSICKPQKEEAKEKLENAIEMIKALNATEKGSLNVAVKIVGNVTKELRDEGGKVNFLLASQALETFAVEYAKTHLKENESDIISEETFGLKIHKVATNNKDALLFSVKETTNFSTEEDWTSITLPSGVLKGNGSVVVFTVYDKISELVPDTEQTGLDGKKFPKLNLRSRIIAATVDPPPDSILQENATISFSFNKESDERETPHCVFWNFTVKSEVNGSWSKKGCSLVKTEDDNISCACNHLTNFAVLMQVGGSEVPSEQLALEVITYVGCALSLIGEILTIIAYGTLTKFKEEQIQIRLNLVIALAIAQIAFLSGINAIEPKGLCVFIAAFIHYFYLVGFAWMLFEGVCLYLKVVKVFNTEVRMRFFLAVAWGVPAGIVALSIAFASGQDGGIHSYVNGAFCWVSFENQIIWTFVAPVLVICVINMVLLSLVIHEIVKMQRNRKSDVERLGQSVKTCVVLFPLLGLTWVFGVLSLTNASLVFQYIFTILNSLQGFFIFVLHVLRSTDVRAEFKRKTQRWMMNGLSSNHVADWPHSTYVWPNNAVNRHVYELNEKPKTTSPSATTSRYHSPIEAPQHGAFTTVDT